MVLFIRKLEQVYRRIDSFDHNAQGRGHSSRAQKSLFSVSPFFFAPQGKKQSVGGKQEAEPNSPPSHSSILHPNFDRIDDPCFSEQASNQHHPRM
jgi:hypothetical protein